MKLNTQKIKKKADELENPTNGEVIRKGGTEAAGSDNTESLTTQQRECIKHRRQAVHTNLYLSPCGEPWNLGALVPVFSVFQFQLAVPVSLHRILSQVAQ